MDLQKAFYTEFFTDGVVNHMVKSGRTEKEIIAALVQERGELLQKITQLALICPKRVKMPDGAIMVWHCPDELIPLEEIKGLNVTPILKPGKYLEVRP